MLTLVKKQNNLFVCPTIAHGTGPDRMTQLAQLLFYNIDQQMWNFQVSNKYLLNVSQSGMVPVLPDWPCVDQDNISFNPRFSRVTWLEIMIPIKQVL